MNSSVNLSELAIDRSDGDRRDTNVDSSSRRRRWLLRYAAPAALLIGFLTLLLSAVGLPWTGVIEVQTVPVVARRSTVRATGTPLFQAPGWIEPRPTPISVPALAPGIIDELLVVEGESVSQGDAIAKLITVDAELAVRAARAALAIREGELKRAIAERDAAQTRVEQPVHLDVQLADAQSSLAAAQTSLVQLPSSIKAAEAKLQYARKNLEGKQAAGSGIAVRTLQQAQSQYAEARANLQQLRDQRSNLQQEVDALKRKSQALQTQRDLLIEERRQLEEAIAKVETASALRDEAQVQLEQAELTLSRMTVTAPIDGRVLRLVSAPGDRVMGQDPGGEHRSSTVVQMYQPDRLQARVDVRLENVPLVSRGQHVEIETASADAVMKGRVLQATSSASVQKNTLEVKVELLDPPPTVTPEMLVTATFLAPETNETQQAKESQRLFVPREAIETVDGGDAVWIVGADNKAQLRPIEVGGEAEGGLVEVKSGVDLTTKLITDSNGRLEVGTAVKITGEDPSLGMESR